MTLVTRVGRRGLRGGRRTPPGGAGARIQGSGAGKGQTPFSGALLPAAEDFLELREQWRQILLDRLPNDVQIDIGVAVDEPIAHSCHLTPRDTRVRLSRWGRNAPRRLAHNLEQPDQG